MSAPSYREKQFGCRCGVIAWSHRHRFQTALQILGTDPTKSLLDYGCGDGVLLDLAAGRFRKRIGVDINLDHVNRCRELFAGNDDVSIYTLDEVGQIPPHSVDLVTCMETLEHCVEADVRKVLRDLGQLCKPDGKIVISVPIETGLTLIAKTVLRRCAGWLGHADYRFYERYGWSDAWRMVFAGETTEFQRPVYGTAEFPNHSHFGFNWKRLGAQLRESFKVERSFCTPLGFLGGWTSSQAWYVCRPKAENAKLR